MKSMAVDRNQSESIVGALLRLKPSTREQQKTSSPENLRQDNFACSIAALSPASPTRNKQ
jgi:hypothetical protein